MARHIIFLVHGMGNFGEGWSSTKHGKYPKTIQAMIKAIFNAWPQTKWMDFDQNFTFHEINYNQEFEALRKKWKNSTEELTTALGTVGIKAGLISKLAELAGQTSKDKFANTHVLDVLLYWGARQTTAAVRSEVITQILKRLIKQFEEEGGYSWSIISHSLGTAVTHDALHAMYATSHIVNGQTITPLSEITFPRCVTMLANVSRVLETDYPVYKSKVAPGAPQRTESICELYFNARHEWDPIPAVKKFDPPDHWPSIKARSDKKYKNVVLRAINPPARAESSPDARVIHDFEHYLGNPKCYAAMVGGLIGKFDLIPADVVDDKHSAYVKKFNDEWQQNAIDKLVKLKVKEGEDDMALILGAWAAFMGRKIQ